MANLHFISTSSFYKDVLEYIYKLGDKQIHNFFYLDEIKLRNYRYNRRDNEVEEKGKILIPGEIEINIMYNSEIIHCKHECIVDHNQNIQKLMLVNECCGGPKGEILFCKITLTNNNKFELYHYSFFYSSFFYHLIFFLLHLQMKLIFLYCYLLK